MTVEAWECPRCGRMNAPFNPTCFCKRDDSKSPILGKNIKERTSPIKWAGDPIPCMPVNGRCLICNGYHGIGVSCMTLKVE